MSELLEGLQYKGVILFLNLQLKYQCHEWRQNQIRIQPTVNIFLANLSKQ